MSGGSWALVLLLLAGARVAPQEELGADPPAGGEDPGTPQDDPSALQLSQMNGDFGFNLYRKMADKHDDNLFVSPLSVSFGLAALMIGSRGDTYQELLTALNWGPLRNSSGAALLPNLLREVRDGVRRSQGYELELGSVAFVHQSFPLSQDFVNQTRTYFDTEFGTLDFHLPEAKTIIRDVIAKKSGGKVADFEEEIDPQTKMILLDFILFKGKWQIPFKPDQTKSESFFITKYQSVKVPMMYKTDEVASVSDKALSCTVFTLPYRGGAHMLLVVPEKGGDFDILEDKLSMELVRTWLARMKTRKTEVFFPKFRLDQKYKLRSALEELGLREVFTGKANLTGMTEERNLRLSEITQKTAIEVDEIGAEASAFTGTEIVAFSLPHIIRVNRPFMFMIFNESYKSLLFIGRMIDPTKS